MAASAPSYCWAARPQCRAWVVSPWSSSSRRPRGSNQGWLKANSMDLQNYHVNLGFYKNQNTMWKYPQRFKIKRMSISTQAPSSSKFYCLVVLWSFECHPKVGLWIFDVHFDRLGRGGYRAERTPWLLRQPALRKVCVYVWLHLSIAAEAQETKKMFDLRPRFCMA